MKNFKIQSHQLLAVEGKDECYFFEALLKYLQIEAVQLLDIGGKDQFSEKFQALYNMEKFETLKVIGFVRDAETNLAGNAFESIGSLLKKYELPVPSLPGSITSRSVPTLITTGIFIMPDNNKTGMLESLCLQTIAATDRSQCIETFVTCFQSCLTPEEREKYKEPKSRVLAYLATKPPIVNSLGLAAQKGYWDFGHPCFQEIITFLRQLFPNKCS